MNAGMRQLSAELYNFRDSINKMLDAEDRYLEAVSAIGSIQSVRPHPERGKMSVMPDPVSYGEKEQQLRNLYRRKIQTEENVKDIEVLLIGMPEEDVKFLEFMFWYRWPAKLVAREFHMELSTVYKTRDRILKKMVEKRRNLQN